MRDPVRVFVWGRWYIGAFCLVELIYRPNFIFSSYVGYTLCLALFVAGSGYVHYRVQSGRGLTSQLMLALSVMDITLITIGMVIAGGFSHVFFYVLYYPALAWFAVFFTSFRLSIAWVTVVAAIYVTASLTAGSGLDFDAKDEKTLLARVVVMYAIVGCVNLVASLERTRRQEAVERERELQREQVGLSRTIHDTTAQSVYMIGLGIETAIELADDSDPELVTKLKATHGLSKAAMWELRHPIDIGLISGGTELAPALKSHAGTFTTITSVPAELIQTGTEPPLSPATRKLLFSMAHNALANALRHSRASKVTIELDFRQNGLRMSIGDDGIGLPDDYAERGHGFRNMRAAAERLGGRLKVESDRSGRGTMVSCVLDYDST